MKHANAGFTLVELMIALMVVGILVAVAMPSYQSYMIKNTRTAAQATLLEIAQREQQYLIDSRSYTNSLTSLNVSVPSTVSDYYTITLTVDAGPPPTFSVTATPISTKRQYGDGILSIDQSGTKSPSDKW